MQTQTIQQRVQVSLEYPVVFTHGVFSSEENPLQDLLKPSASGAPARCLVLCDSGVADAFPALSDQITSWFSARSDSVELVHPVEVVPGGEAVKNDYRRVMSFVDLMLECHLCRHSYVIVIGGGALLDAAGFAAALVHRGLRLIRMPSTTLAQDDAGVGVKNGMNLHGTKNTVGVFAAPAAVINDLSLLAGQTDEHWIGGVSEAFKVAMIRDADFFNELCELSPALGQRDPAALERVVIRCAELHLMHIASSGDAFELGSARPLDFGHWSAHKLENLSNYRISHGHAVALGIALDSYYALDQGWLPQEEFDRLITALQQCGFDLDVPEWHQRQGDGRRSLFQGLDEFQEHLGGQLCLAMPDGIGCLRDIDDVDERVFEAGIEVLAARAGSGTKIRSR